MSVRFITCVFLLAAAARSSAQEQTDLSRVQSELRETLRKNEKISSLPDASWSKKGPYVRLPVWEMAALANQNAFSGASTKLTDVERGWAREIFKDGLDLDVVRVVYAPSPTDAPMVWGNTIRMPGGYGTNKATMIHELVHVWQYQNMGMTYLSDSFLKQACSFILTGDRSGAYNYVLVEGKSFFDYSAEQQAEIVEAFAVNAERQKDPRYTTLIAQLRARVGAKKFTPLDAAVMLEKDAGLPSRWHALPPGPNGPPKFNGEAGGVPQFELRF